MLPNRIDLETFLLSVLLILHAVIQVDMPHGLVLPALISDLVELAPQEFLDAAEVLDL